MVKVTVNFSEAVSNLYLIEDLKKQFPNFTNIKLKSSNGDQKGFVMFISYEGSVHQALNLLESIFNTATRNLDYVKSINYE